MTFSTKISIVCNNTDFGHEKLYDDEKNERYMQLIRRDWYERVIIWVHHTSFGYVIWYNENKN